MKLPVTTLLVIGVCIFLEFGFLSERKLQSYKLTVCLDSTILRNFKDEAYRLIASTLFHANVQHLAVNLITLWSIGNFLESVVGSFSMATIFLSFTLLSNSLTIAFQSFMLNNPQIDFPAILGSPRSCSIGISGVLFAMSVLASSLRKEGIKGFIFVWLEVLVISAFIPNVSFLGHMSGVIVGTIYSFYIHSEDAEDVKPRAFWSTLFWTSIVGISSPFFISKFYESKQSNLRTWGDIYSDSKEYFEVYGKSWLQSPTKQLKKMLTRWNIIEDNSTVFEQAQVEFEDIFLRVQDSDAIKSTAKFLKEKLSVEISRELIVWILLSLVIVMMISLIQTCCTSPPKRRRERDEQD